MVSEVCGVVVLFAAVGWYVLDAVDSYGLVLVLCVGGLGGLGLC